MGPAEIEARIAKLEGEMHEAAEELRFGDAGELRDQIRDLKQVLPGVPEPEPGRNPEPEPKSESEPNPKPESEHLQMISALSGAERPAPAGDLVDCTVFAPPVVSQEARPLVQVFLHTPAQADDARALAEEFDPAAKRRMFRGLEVPLPFGSVVDVELDMPTFTVDEPVQRLVWRGRAEAVTFATTVPADHPGGAAHGTAIVRLSGVPIGRVGFQLTIVKDATTGPAVPLEVEPIRFSQAFVSYASADRERVLTRVQGIAATGLQYFQDVLSLSPGERYEPEIFKRIDRCDLFLLFWSKAAKNSEWVKREVLHALGRQTASDGRLPEIRPVILDGPPVELPWPELGHLHFNDELIYVMAG
jgi:hypothetical protein